MATTTQNPSTVNVQLGFNDADIALILAGQIPESMKAKIAQIQADKALKEKRETIKLTLQSIGDSFISLFPDAQSIPKQVESIKLPFILYNAKEDISQNILTPDALEYKSKFPAVTAELELLLSGLDDQTKAVKQYFTSVLTDSVIDGLKSAISFNAILDSIRSLKENEQIKNALTTTEGIDKDQLVKFTFVFIPEFGVNKDTGEDAKWICELTYSDRKSTSVAKRNSQPRVPSATSDSINGTGPSRMSIKKDGKQVNVGKIIQEFPEDNPLKIWYNEHSHNSKTIEAASFYAKRQLGESAYVQALIDGGCEVTLPTVE